MQILNRLVGYTRECQHERVTRLKAREQPAYLSNEHSATVLVAFPKHDQKLTQPLVVEMGRQVHPILNRYQGSPLGWRCAGAVRGAHRDCPKNL